MLANGKDHVRFSYQNWAARWPRGLQQAFPAAGYRTDACKGSGPQDHHNAAPTCHHRVPPARNESVMSPLRQCGASPWLPDSRPVNTALLPQCKQVTMKLQCGALMAALRLLQVMEANHVGVLCRTPRATCSGHHECRICHHKVALTTVHQHKHLSMTPVNAKHAHLDVRLCRAPRATSRQASWLPASRATSGGMAPARTICTSISSFTARLRRAPAAASLPA